MLRCSVAQLLRCWGPSAQSHLIRINFSKSMVSDRRVASGGQLAACGAGIFVGYSKIQCKMPENSQDAAHMLCELCRTINSNFYIQSNVVAVVAVRVLHIEFLTPSRSIKVRTICGCRGLSPPTQDHRTTGNDTEAERKRKAGKR